MCKMCEQSPGGGADHHLGPLVIEKKGGCKWDLSCLITCEKGGKKLAKPAALLCLKKDKNTQTGGGVILNIF